MLRFTIRDVLWLMVVVGLAVGWYAERKITARRHLVERDRLYVEMIKMYRSMTPKQQRQQEMRWTPEPQNAETTTP